MEKPGRSLDDGQGQGSDKPRVTGRPRTQALARSRTAGLEGGVPGMGRRWIGLRDRGNSGYTHRNGTGSSGRSGLSRSDQVLSGTPGSLRAGEHP